MAKDIAGNISHLIQAAKEDYKKLILNVRDDIKHSGDMDAFNHFKDLLADREYKDAFKLVYDYNKEGYGESTAQSNFSAYFWYIVARENNYDIPTILEFIQEVSDKNRYYYGSDLSPEGKLMTLMLNGQQEITFTPEIAKHHPYICAHKILGAKVKYNDSWENNVECDILDLEYEGDRLTKNDLPKVKDLLVVKGDVKQIAIDLSDDDRIKTIDLSQCTQASVVTPATLCSATEKVILPEAQKVQILGQEVKNLEATVERKAGVTIAASKGIAAAVKEHLVTVE